MQSTPSLSSEAAQAFFMYAASPLTTILPFSLLIAKLVVRKISFLLPVSLNSLSDQLLVSVGAVDIAGVSECYSQVGSASEDFARGSVVMTAERAVSE